MTKKKTVAATTEVAEAVTKPKAPMSLKDIALGKLVGEIRDVVVPFYHNGALESVEVRVQQLPYVKTEAFQRRLNEQDDKVIADWISAALVDEDDKTYITPEQVEQHFTQSLVGAIFAEVSGLQQLQKYVDELGKDLAMKTNSGQSLSSTASVDEA